MPIPTELMGWKPFAPSHPLHPNGQCGDLFYADGEDLFSRQNS